MVAITCFFQSGFYFCGESFTNHLVLTHPVQSRCHISDFHAKIWVLKPINQVLKNATSSKRCFYLHWHLRLFEASVKALSLTLMMLSNYCTDFLSRAAFIHTYRRHIQSDDWLKFKNRKMVGFVPLWHNYKCICIPTMFFFTPRTSTISNE